MSILRIAVPAPLRRTFDYLPPPGCPDERLRPGTRVRVPFGRGRRVGILVERAETSELADSRLRRAEAVLDAEPLVSHELIALARWAGRYYHHPLGEVLAAMLPAPLRRGRPARPAGSRRWRLTEAGRAASPAELRGPRQAALLRRLGEHPEGLSAEALAAEPGDWRGALRALTAKGWAEATSALPCPSMPRDDEPEIAPQLNADQARAVACIGERLEGFRPWLLDGVTGSGKTEVYLRLIEQALAAGRQALVLVPEIALTPQLIRRFERRLAAPLVVLHSGLGEQERLSAWLAARAGRAPVVIGTRSAVFTPLAAPGVLIVDEEHDPSYKQQEGFRYSARDVAVVRARHLEVPVVLGSATPSLESLYNVERGRYGHLSLPERAGSARPPRIEVLDLRGKPVTAGLSAPLIEAMGEALTDGGQVLLFLNRRGYAPTLLCHECGWVAECRRCDAHLIFHQRQRRLRCHHCGAERPVEAQCPGCGAADLRPVGEGTERIEEALAARFPQVGIARIDRDTTRRRGALQALLEAARRGEHSILIGTQMLAKGHHFPNVTLVGVIDGDQGLFGADFRAAERMAQLILQVAGRAGRADRPGRVLVQTHYPEHPLLAILTREGYAAFARAVLAERRAARLPPVTALALLRAEAPAPQAPLRFLEAAAVLAGDLAPPEVTRLGPVPAPMERRAGRHRAQLLLQADDRGPLHALLEAWVPRLGELAEARRVRWSIDVDPQDML
ncbi:MAG: primosomal protein N' [Gammaproteobacteria bacterium]|nr:primosomal protein N' [Gammaproteobacteria bacterium]